MNKKGISGTALAWIFIMGLFLIFTVGGGAPALFKISSFVGSLPPVVLVFGAVLLIWSVFK